MTRLRRPAARRLAIGLSVGASALVALPGSAPAATIWQSAATPAGTGEINAIDYQSEDRFWFATTNGKLAYREGGTFKFGTGTPTLDSTITFNDIAFEPDSNVGIAVGNSDNIWRTTDGGKTWTKIEPTTLGKNFCSDPGTPGAQPGDMYSVAWGPGNVVYLTGDKFTVLRSEDDGQNFVEVNKRIAAGCAIEESINDMAVLAGGAGRLTEKLYLQEHGSFGRLFFSSDGLTSTAQSRAELVNSTDPFNKFAYDPNNANRVWSIGREGFTGWSFSENGGANIDYITGSDIANAGDRKQENMYDIAFAGGTTLFAGNAGQIVTSIDPKQYFYQYADGALESKDWRSVDTYDGKHAAVGGRDGALALTDKANTVPDIVPPTGTIVGPAQVVETVPAGFSAALTDNAGGSGVDPASIEWFVNNAKAGTGAQFVLTAPLNSFSVSLKVRFKDLAGNAGETTKSVSVADKPATALPQVTFSFARNGIPQPTTKRDSKGRRITTIKVKGKLAVPAGIPIAAACRGNVTITINDAKRRRNILVRKAKVSSKTCAYSKTIRFLRSKVRGNKITVVLEFPGNTVVARSTFRKTLKIRG